jgi:hypothetical protein
MAKFNTGVSFADGDTVTGADLNNITSQLNIYTGVISEQTAMVATVSTADQLLIADTDNGDSGAANRVTIQKLLNDTLTNGTYTNAQLSGNLNVAQLSTLGTISSTRGTVGILNSTTGTIAGLNTTTGTIATLNSTTGTVATLNSTTGTITGLNSTNGTVATLNSTTGTITNLRSTTGTVATLNSTTGTITGLNTTTGTIATLNSTTGTITGLNTTTGTIATLNSTTGTITNLSTTLAGDFTISQGTGAVGSGKITFPMLSTSATQADNAASRVARAWVNFDGGLVTNPASANGIRASLNVSSITDNGTGDYTVNFTVAMSDANYCATTGWSTGSIATSFDGSCSIYDVASVLAGSIRIFTSQGVAASAGEDSPYVAVSILR